jgi:hypothetical protein
MIKNLLREMLSAVLQGIGWTIGMAVCGFAFVAFHLIIWPVLILIIPVTIILFWRNPHFVGHRWERIRQWIWELVRKRYGYTRTTISAIEGNQQGLDRIG